MKDEGRNRAALLTPPGAAAIAALRLSGPGAVAFLAEHFSKPVATDRCVHGLLRDGERVIDDPVVVLHDHGVDINFHGGEWVVRECVELAQREGFEIVEDATQLIESENLIEQEMLLALPQARTEQAIRILLAQPTLWKQIESRDDIERIRDDRSLWWLLNPPRVAIVGIANVGKSTLANQLFGSQRSITADIPGTTRDWVGDWANLDGLPVMLLDTPGQRESKDAIEQRAIERSRSEIQQADLVIVVLDPTQSAPEQMQLRERYSNALIVVNKIDRPPFWNPGFDQAIRTIATTGQGVDELRRRIVQRFDCSDLTAQRPRWWTQRQRELLQRLQ